MNKTDEFEEEMIKLVEKYKAQICYVASIINEDKSETVSFAGNMCFVCAKDALVEYIINENIDHNMGRVH